MPSVWKYINERPSTNQDGELYSSVADLYHDFRPRYPEELMNAVASSLPMNGRILEIGSGPGTATFPLLKRGFHMTCIEPSSGMIQKAKHVCHEYMESRVTFHQATLQEFLEKANSEKETYDAIVAATSFHWAMDNQGNVVKQCHELLKPNGSLVLLWNIPPEPNENVRNAVAKALDRDIPFYFSAKNREQHKHDICETVLAPVRATGLFHDFESHDYPTETIMPISNFISMVRTFSHYIRMPEEERTTFFDIAETTMTKLCETKINVSGLSLLHVSAKVNDMTQS